MTAIVKAGEKGVDFSFARPPAVRLLELGYTFVVGYISVPPASPAKNITAAECDAYIAAGLKVLLVWEMSASSPNQGAPAGTSHGRDAKTQATARGYPTDVPILCADDTNTTPANIDAHEAYVRAFAAACAPYPIGVYGDTDILGRCTGLWQVGWLPNAWSWSGTSRVDAEAKAKALGAHVLQRKGFWIDNVWAVDPNDAIADFPAWGKQNAPIPPTPTPPPGGDDMASTYFSVDTLPGEYLLRDGCDPVPFASAADRDALVNGMQIRSAGTISLDMYQRLFAKPVEVTIPPITVPPLTGHLVADIDTGTWHVTGSVG